MDPASLSLYLAYLAVMALAWWYGLRLVRSFRFYFLPAFLGYLVTLNLVALVNLVVNVLSAEILRPLPPAGLLRVYMLFGLVAIPLLAVSFYFLLAFVSGLLDRELPAWARGAYAALWLAFAALFILRIHFELRGQPLPWVERLYGAFSSMIIVIPLVVLAVLAWQLHRRRAEPDMKEFRWFAAAALFGCFLYLAAAFIGQLGNRYRWLTPLLLFLANFLPLLSLKRALARHFRPVPHGPTVAPALAAFAAHYRLSEREREILDLLLLGKSNKEIDSELFISAHTVRNHVHNIYEKLGVGSRLQLMNSVRSWLEKQNA